VTERDELTSRQQRAIASLLRAPTQAEAASDAGISRRTLVRWLREPLFRNELRRQSSLAISDATAALAAGASDAASVLRAIATNRRAPTAPRVQAARALLDLAVAFEERDAIVQRLERLEAALAARPGPGAN
jgi:hypothetical protein